MFVSCTLKKPPVFDLIRNRDLPNTRVDLKFIVFLILCFATVFSVGTEELYLSFVKVNKYSIQCSDALLDHTDHWIILFIDDIAVLFLS